MSFRYSLGYLALPGVLTLISFLSFSSQYLFTHLPLEPGPLTKQERLIFNSLIATLLICYARAVLTDPGAVPKGWKPPGLSSEEHGSRKAPPQPPPRWCRKCEAYKPPRAHHCKICKRCVPKMDHHCPWTVNCVSHITYPHFLRFVGYADLAILYLEYFLIVRVMALWEDRDMPSTYGPSAAQLVHLFVLIIVNSLTLFALGILWIRAVWNLVVNTYTIEGWEIERHNVLLRRARVLGGYLDGPDGKRIRIVRQEFPYDIGFWGNLKQGMGTGNPLSWLNPLAPSPTIASSLTYPTNDFTDPSLSWPPPDPDRMPRQRSTYQSPALSSGYTPTDIAAFKVRQQDDLLRRRQKFHHRFDEHGTVEGPRLNESDVRDGEEGEESWRTREGESLADFGVDEGVEFYDIGNVERQGEDGNMSESSDVDEDEDVPLGELIRRRRGRRAGDGLLDSRVDDSS